MAVSLFLCCVLFISWPCTCSFSYPTPSFPSFHPASRSVFTVDSGSRHSGPPFASALHAIRKWMATTAPGRSCAETRKTIQRPDTITLHVSFFLSLSPYFCRCSLFLDFHLFHDTALAECTWRACTKPPHTNTTTDTNTTINTINERTLKLQLQLK